MKKFKSPKKTLGDVDTDTAAAIVAAAADIALVLDRDGTIRDVAFGNPEIESIFDRDWTGQKWSATVTVECRAKVEDLLKDVESGVPTRWRELNHPVRGQADAAFTYSLIPLGGKGRSIAIGRDLRVISGLQRRLVDAQQSVEREYARLRNAETRYRLMFQLAAESVLVLDANTLRVVEANPAAALLFGLGNKRTVGRVFPEGFDARSTAALQAMLATVRAGGRSSDVKARLEADSRDLIVSAAVFREDRHGFLLVRAIDAGSSAGRTAAESLQARVSEVIDASVDGFVMTDKDGRILAVNGAFLDLGQIPNAEQARGESLERWLGRPGVDLNVLIAQLREHGSVRFFATTVRGVSGASTDVEVSCVAVPDADPPCYGFSIRDVGSRRVAGQRQPPELSRSVQQLTELVGRVPLKDLVRETTDMIERLCIEAALELTQDNRASAAEMLGLSRQSLYVKLRRHGLGDLVSSDEEY